MVLFVLLDIDVVLNRSFKRLVLILNQHLVFLPVFFIRFKMFFISCKALSQSIKQWNNRFSSSFPHLIKEIFHWSKLLVFLLVFLSSLGNFSSIDTYGFSFIFLLDLRGFFFTNKSHDLKRLYVCWNLHLREKIIVKLRIW